MIFVLYSEIEIISNVIWRHNDVVWMLSKYRNDFTTNGTVYGSMLDQ